MPEQQRSLLVIDDEQYVRESLSAYLEDSGYQVAQAPEGETGLALFRELHPDVVLLDLKMPGMNGIDVLKALGEDPSETPVIVISGAGVMADVVEALRYGASDYLIKPIGDMEVLEHSIARCLEQSKLRRENRTYRQQLEGANRELQASLLLLRQDQQAGRHVQKKMLPATPKDYGPYRFSHSIYPSLYLSGDLVDYFMVGDHQVVFFIADVSGHGASSAFVTVLLKNLFARKRSDYSHNVDQDVLSPSAMLDYANNELLGTALGKHVTMCVGTLDLATNTLIYSVAGHLPMPILCTGGKAQYLRAKNPPVGLFDNASYREASIELPASFVMTMFTDGLLEVLGPSGILAQEQYLLEKLAAEPTTLAGVSEVLGLDEVTEAPDDIAVLLIHKGS